MSRETPIKGYKELPKKHTGRNVKEDDYKEEFGFTFKELVENWQMSKEFNSPWCNQEMWMEQTLLRAKEKLLYEDELQNQLSRLPQSGTTVTAGDSNGMIYDCHVAKDGTLTVTHADIDNSVTDIKYYRGGRKQFLYLEKTLTQWSNKNRTDAVERKIKRYVLRTKLLPVSRPVTKSVVDKNETSRKPIKTKTV